MAAVEQHTVYKRELRAGDVVSVRSTVLLLGEKSIHLFHEMRNDETGEIAATSTIVGVYMHAVTRKAQPWPLDVRELATRGFDNQEDELPVDSGRDLGDQGRISVPSIRVCG